MTTHPMLRRVCVGLLASPLLAFSLSATTTQVQVPGLYRAYLAGSPDEVARAFGDRAVYQAARPELRRLIDSWRPDSPSAAANWAPSHAGFVLEVAATVRGFDLAETISLLDSVRDILAARPVPEPRKGGSVGPNDRFELAVHRVAVALLGDVPKAAEGYLDHIAGRIDALRQLGGPELVAPIALARGVVTDAWTRAYPPGARATAGPSGTLGPSARGTSRIPSDRDVAFEAASQAYSDAERFKSVAAEAGVRQGFLLLRWGKSREALAAIDRGLAATGDDANVKYLGELFRGRVLMSLGRMVEAEQAYRRAASLAPHAQSAAAALAALLVIGSRVNDAESWAARARAEDGPTDDPWRFYWLGDARQSVILWRVVRGARP